MTLTHSERVERILVHKRHWDLTLHERSDRYSDGECTMYRMAMAWVAEQLTADDPPDCECMNRKATE
jgi:hypothetical protein